MACGCDSKMGCTCQLVGGQGVVVSGMGSAGDPFIIDSTIVQTGVSDTPSLDLTLASHVISGKVRLAPLLGVADSPTLDLNLSGFGNEASPFILSGELKGIVLEPSVSGDVMTRKPDGSWGPGPATQAPAGAVTSANGLSGDGSGPDPVRITAMSYADWEAVVDAAVF
jgi:hypothetical protein